MKTTIHYATCALAVLLCCSCATTPKEQRAKPVIANLNMEQPPKPMSAKLIMLDAQISAANGHYKTVLITIADKQMNAKITQNQSELEQLNNDLAILAVDRNATEEQLAELVEKYNAALKQK